MGSAVTIRISGSIRVVYTGRARVRAMIPEAQEQLCEFVAFTSVADRPVAPGIAFVWLGG